MSAGADGNERKQDGEKDQWNHREKWGQMTGDGNRDDGQQYRNLWPGTRWYCLTETNCLLWESKPPSFSSQQAAKKVMMAEFMPDLLCKSKKNNFIR